MLEALRKSNVLLRLAALEYMERHADPSHYEVVERLLKDKASNLRAAAISAAVRCGGSRAVPTLMGMLRDVSWEVRRESIKALGRIGDATVIDGLARALQDRDHDVRESAAMALGGIGDPGDPSSSAGADGHRKFCAQRREQFAQRNRSALEKTADARSALPQIKAALKHREYWISHSAAKLLGQIPADSPGDGVVPPRLAPEKRFCPADHPAKNIRRGLCHPRGTAARPRPRPAARGGGSLRPVARKKRVPILATAIQDDDAFVRQAAERALIALN